MSHANEFWNFENADRSENTPKGYFKPLFPHNLGRPLHHPEQDYNAHLIGQIIKGYRVIGSGPDGEMTTADLELGIKLHEVNPGDGTPGSADADYAHYIEAGAKDYEWIWVPAEMGGTVTSPLAVSGVVTDRNDCTSTFAQITAQATGGTPMYEFSLQTSNAVNFGNITDWATSNVFFTYNNAPLVPGQTYYIYIKDAVNTNVISSALTPNQIVSHGVGLDVTQNVTFPNGDDAELTATVLGGVGPFNYELYQGSIANPAMGTFIEEVTGSSNSSIVFPVNASGGSSVSIGAGEYFVLITDATTGCSINSSVELVTQPQPLTSSYVLGNATCYQGTHEFTFNGATGGTAPYEYSITDPNTGGYTWSTDLFYDNIPAGATTIYPAVKDASGFIQDLGAVTFEDPAQYSFTVTPTDTNCSGIGGSITFGALTGGPSTNMWPLPEQWQFSIDNGATWSSTFTETNPGDTYTYIVPMGGVYRCKIRRVLDSSGEIACESPFVEVTVGSATSISASHSHVDDVICGTGGSGEINITDILIGNQNATLEYTVEWEDANNPAINGSATGQTAPSYDITGLDASVYSVTLTDTLNSSECTHTFTVEILNATSNIGITLVGNDALCNGGDGSIDWSISGGVAPYNVEVEINPGVWAPIEMGTSNTSGTASSIGVGSHTFRVIDTNGCTDTSQATISEPAEVVASITKDADAGCFGQSNGQLTANGTGGNGIYTYLWSNGETTQTISGLQVGTYSVVITDGNGCTSSSVSEDITSYNNTTVVLDSQINVSCNGGSDGSAQITVTGDAPFTYQWIDVATNNIVSTDQNPTGLPAGEYVVFVSNASGSCQVSSSAQGWTLVLTEPPAISASFTTTNETISGQNDGQVVIDVIGGTLEYSIMITDSSNNSYAQEGTGGQTQFTYTSLAPDTWTVLIQDANGCQHTDTFTISTGADGVSIDSLLQVEVPCDGGETDIQITVSGGSFDYEFSIDGTNWIGAVTGAAQPYTYTFPNGVTAGTYTYYVKDTSTGAIVSESITVVDLNPVTATYSVQNQSLSGANDGEITISNLNGGSGTYVSVELFDSNNISIEVISAPGPYVFSGLSDGTYYATITDDNGCIGTVNNITITTLYNDIAITNVTANVVCFGATSDGILFITATGGSPEQGAGSYQYSIDGGNTYNGGNGVVSGLAAGNYNVWVKDSTTGQEVEWSSNPVQITEADEIQVITSTMTDGTCASGPSYYIKFSGSNITSNLASQQSVDLVWTSTSYNASANVTSLGNNQFEATFNSFGPSSISTSGEFNVTITSDGCEKQHGPITYSTSDPITMNATLISEPECPTDDWVYEISAVGGPSASYNLDIDGGANLATNWNGSATQYNIPQNGGNTTIIVEHVDFANNACSANTTINTNNTLALTISGSVSNPDCATDGSSTMSFSITGGQPSGNSYKYKVSTDNGSTFGPEQDYLGAISNQAVNDGDIVIRAYRISNGNSTESTCAVEQFIGSVTNPVSINGSVYAAVSPSACTGANSTNGSIIMTVSGGTGSYQFTKDGGVTWQTLPLIGGYYTYDNLSAGTYNIQARDTNGCYAFTDTVTLSSPSSPTVSGTFFSGCWRHADDASVTLRVDLTDAAGQGNGEYTFYDPDADAPTTNTSGTFTYSNSDMTTHIQGPIVITETATGCSTTLSNFNFTPAPAVVSTAAFINSNNSGGSSNDADDLYINNISGGYGGPYTVEVINSSNNVIQTNSNVTTSTTFFDLPAGFYTYRIFDSTYNGGTGCGRTYTTPMESTQEVTTEETFYYFHAGGGNVAPYSDLMSTNATWYTSAGTGTEDINVIMTDMINNGNGTTYPSGVTMPTVGSFEFSGPIAGNNCGQTWTYTASSGQNFYYLAVPNNSSFPEDLTVGSGSAGYFQYSCNGLDAYAASKRQFTYNGELYWLYKLQTTTGTAGIQVGFK